MSSRVVIAGGRGLIGRALTAALLRRGDDVVVLTRGDASAEPVTNSAGASVHHVVWDGVNPGPWVEQLNGAAAVVNLCGENIGRGRWTAPRKREIEASRVEPGRAVADATLAVDQPPGVLVQASGVGFYGPGELAATETAEVGRDFLAELAAKWEASSAHAEIRRVVTRFGVVLARQGGALGQMLLPFRLFVGGPIASGEQWLSWVHITDAVAAIIVAIDSTDLSGAVNVTAPDAVRNREFAALAGEVLRRPSFFRVPRAVMTLVLGEQATLVCDGQRAVPAVLRERGFNFSFPTMREALFDITR